MDVHLLEFLVEWFAFNCISPGAYKRPHIHRARDTHNRGFSCRIYAPGNKNTRDEQKHHRSRLNKGGTDWSRHSHISFNLNARAEDRGGMMHRRSYSIETDTFVSWKRVFFRGGKAVKKRVGIYMDRGAIFPRPRKSQVTVCARLRQVYGPPLVNLIAGYIVVLPLSIPPHHLHCSFGIVCAFPWKLDIRSPPGQRFHRLWNTALPGTGPTVPSSPPLSATIPQGPAIGTLCEMHPIHSSIPGAYPATREKPSQLCSYIANVDS